jgi:DNA-binding NtrC family response regulator
MHDVRLIGRTILIIEDEPLIALDLAIALTAAGAVATIEPSVDSAMGAHARRTWSAAVADFRLGGETCARACRCLDLYCVPFMFYSGRAVDDFQEWPHAPVVEKPALLETIVDVVADMASHSTPARTIVTPNLFPHGL